MSEKCEVCKKEIEEVPFEYVNVSFSPALRLMVCGDCMNLLSNQEWDKLNEILERLREED